jgi:uncharacterized protein with HEPN domain
MTESREYLKFLMRGSLTAREAALGMVRAAVRRDTDAERAAFQMLCGHLMAIAYAIGELPRDLLDHEPGFPWRELARLPDLLGRPDFHADARVIWRTLDVPLRQLRVAAQRLYGHTRMPDKAFFPGTEDKAQGGRPRERLAIVGAPFVLKVSVCL